MLRRARKLAGTHLFVANVGDSSAYVFRGSEQIPMSARRSLGIHFVEGGMQAVSYGLRLVLRTKDVAPAQNHANV